RSRSAGALAGSQAVSTNERRQPTPADARVRVRPTHVGSLLLMYATFGDMQRIMHPPSITEIMRELPSREWHTLAPDIRAAVQRAYHREFLDAFPQYREITGGR